MRYLVFFFFFFKKFLQFAPTFLVAQNLESLALIRHRGQWFVDENLHYKYLHTYVHVLYIHTNTYQVARILYLAGIARAICGADHTL